MSRFHYFNEDEVEGLAVDLVIKLDAARHMSKVAFLITSGKRSLADNRVAGGVKDSSHLGGLAVDLFCDNSPDRFAMVASLLQVGFTRIGVYERHVHADIDVSKPQGVLWLGHYL